MKVLIKTYGCTLNQADSNIIRSILEGAGYDVALTSDLEGASSEDICIINTCTVKKPTVQKISYELQRLSMQKKKIIATGCLASADANLVKKFAPDASIVTIGSMQKIAEAVEYAKRGKSVVFDAYEKLDRLTLFRPGSSVIAKIPIADGCTGNCSFCETKFARGPLNSFSEDLIIEAIKRSVERGAKEIELTAQDVGAYGIDIGTDICELLSRIAALEGDFKVRIGMLNPEHLGKHIEEFGEIMKDRHFYKFIHIPVQSGSNRVLKAMKRYYSVEETESYIEYMREAVPGITIETDIIVGFPTESEEDFEETIKFLKAARPDVTNVSKFGAMPHTEAAKMEQLPSSVVRSRSIETSRIVRSLQAEANNRFIGSSVDILITEENERSFNGRMDNYKQVVLRAKSNEELGKHYRVLIDGASSNVLFGRRIEE
ncbi:MAG: tRNA (N(6)-L-threonylcarbamoyladenosine(37)-C(2))-methylthiotransferase [Candidatus Micrarchaeia archaeon]